MIQAFGHWRLLMSDQRPKKRAKLAGGGRPTQPDAFAEFGLNRADFEVRSGFGLSFIAHQRIVWTSVTHRPTGRQVSGKIGTTKKGKDAQREALLRLLLRSFRQS
jgi:hypothetical protein